MHSHQKCKILIAEDDADDRFLIEDAFTECNLTNELEFVVDGVDLMDYLNRRGKYTELEGEPLPNLILLDLNMPRMDGRSVKGYRKGRSLSEKYVPGDRSNVSGWFPGGRAQCHAPLQVEERPVRTVIGLSGLLSGNRRIRQGTDCFSTCLQGAQEDSVCSSKPPIVLRPRYSQ